MKQRETLAPSRYKVSTLKKTSDYIKAERLREAIPWFYNYLFFREKRKLYNRNTVHLFRGN